MLNPIRSCLLLLILSPLFQPAMSQEVEFNPLGRKIPIEELPTLVRIQVEWIELPHLKMSEILRKDAERKRSGGPVSTDGGPLRASLETLIGEGEARVVETSLITCRSGQKATVESIAEHIFPTEYEPGGIVERPGKMEGKPTEVSTLPLATAFETKNLGVTVEVEPTIGENDQLIDLRILPEIVYLVGKTTYGKHKEGESEVEVEMPTFYKVACNTAVVLLTGQQFFLASQTPVNLKTGQPDADLRVMTFVKAEVCYVGLDEEAEEAE